MSDLIGLKSEPEPNWRGMYYNEKQAHVATKKRLEAQLLDTKVELQSYKSALEYIRTTIGTVI